MVEGAKPSGRASGPGVLNGCPGRIRVTLVKVEHLSSIHRAHSSAVQLLAEGPLRARLSESLDISRTEIELLTRRVRSSDLGQQYRLEDVFESVRTSLNSVREDLLAAIHAAIGQPIPELVPEPISEPPPTGMNEEALVSSASVPPPPPAPPPIVPSSTETGVAEEPPKPVPLEVTAAGARETSYQRWYKTLDLRQIQALEYLRGFERGDLWEKIHTNRVIMRESAKFSGRPIDQVLFAIADLMECRVKGLPQLLSGLAEKCGNSEEAGIAEAWGGIHEVIRLAKLAKAQSTAGPLTEVTRILRGVKYYREEFKGGHFTSIASREREEDVEADGYRAQTRTVIEVKSSEVPLRFNNRGGREADWELRFRNQARKLRAAVRSGRIGAVEYHITAPEIDNELLYYLKRTIRDKDDAVRVRVFFYTLLNEWEGMEQEMIDLDGPRIRTSKDDKPAADPAKTNHREWNEAAWVWALGKYTGEAGKFKDFNGDPFNLHKVVRQPQTRAVIRSLQEELNKAIAVAQQEKVQAGTSAEKKRADDKIARAQTLKKTIAQSRKNLDTNSLSTSTICKFSFVLQEVRELLGG